MHPVASSGSGWRPQKACDGVPDGSDGVPDGSDGVNGVRFLFCSLGHQTYLRERLQVPFKASKWPKWQKDVKSLYVVVVSCTCFTDHRRRVIVSFGIELCLNSGDQTNKREDIQ